jgi:hypothetical protein
MALGNAMLAAQGLCGGRDWEEFENWVESPLDTYTRMMSFVAKLDGTVLVKHKVACPISGVTVSEPVHSNCTLAPEIEELVKAAFKRVEDGLGLGNYGNQAYRNKSQPYHSHSPRLGAERAVSNFENSIEGLDFQNIPFGGEADQI